MNQLPAGISPTPVPDPPPPPEIPLDDHPPLTVTPPTPEQVPPSLADREESTILATTSPNPITGDLVIGGFLQHHILGLFFAFREGSSDEYNWGNYVSVDVSAEAALRKHVLTYQYDLITALTRDKLDELAMDFMLNFNHYSAIYMFTIFANLTDLHLTRSVITSLLRAVLWCPNPGQRLALIDVLNVLRNRLKANCDDMTAFRGEMRRICNAYGEQVGPMFGNHDFMGLFLLTTLSTEGVYDRLRLVEQCIRNRGTATYVQLLEIRYFVAGKQFNTHGPSDPLSEQETRMLDWMAWQYLNNCRDDQRAIHYAEMASYYLAQCEYERSQTDPFLRQIAIDRLDASIKLLGEYKWEGEQSPIMTHRRSLAHKWRTEAFWALQDHFSFGRHDGGF